MRLPSVAYIIPFAFEYRQAFNERMRRRLAARGIDYDFIYCREPHFTEARGNLVVLPWATSVKCSRWRFGPLDLRYQHALRIGLSKDLVILQQGNGLLLNYLLILGAKIAGVRTAYFGHGKNFQAVGANRWRERFKRFWVNKVDWWFAYTQRSADVVAGAGFPRERITVVNNAVDTTAISAHLGTISSGERDRLRKKLVDDSRNVGVYVGGLYPEKRLGFLFEAVVLVRKAVPDFHLVIVGGGQDSVLVEQAAHQHAWIHYAGPKFGREKSLLASLGRVFLMPGLVGLAVLDSFAYGTPMVTTDLPYHSPEIDYLVDGVNGVMVRERKDPQAYADAVVRVLTDAGYREALKSGAAESLENYSLEHMLERFSDGILQALAAR